MPPVRVAFHRPIRVRLVLLCAACVPVLVACGGSEAVCRQPDEPYLSAVDNPSLRVPDGLTPPGQSDELAIPDAKSSESPSGRAGCLDEPPSYFRSAGTVARAPEEVVAGWAQAWANREADALIALYSTTFKAPTEPAGTAQWLEQRREQVATGPVPDPAIQGLKVEPDGEDRRIATFVQKFGHNSLRKELTLVRESGSWRIAAENVSAVN